MKLSKRRQRVVLGALVAGLLATRPGRADDSPLELQLNAPAECASARQVEDAVATMVRREAPRLRATIDVGWLDGQYVAVVRTEPDAERRLAASGCRALLEAASVVLALAIDPHARRDAAAPAEPPPAPPAPAAPPARPRPTILAALALDSSTLPRAAVGATLGAGVAWPRWSGWLKVNVWNSQDTVSASRPARGGHFGWWTGALSLCGAPLQQGWLSLCVSPEIGRLTGAGIGEGISTRRSASGLWLAVGAGPALQWQFAEHWALRGEAMAVVTAVGRHPFVVEVEDSAQLVHRPGRVSARFSWGLAARF